jgi:hypothetical protein
LKNYKQTPYQQQDHPIDQERDLLAHLESVEFRSLQRVYDSQVFSGLTRQQIEDGARNAVFTGKVQLRNGFADFFHYLHQRRQVPHAQPDFAERESPESFHILSVNWSEVFISSCLRNFRVPIGSLPLFDPNHIFPRIICNELAYIHETLPADKPSTGSIVPAVVTSSQKVCALDDIVKACGTPVVYIGDSWTDYECLIGADLGICMRDEPMTESQLQLHNALGRAGVIPQRLADVYAGEYLYSGRKMKGVGRVVWVRDFHEILEWLGSIYDAWY